MLSKSFVRRANRSREREVEAMMDRRRMVHGSLDSPATLKVLALLFELDLDFDFIPVDVEAGENLRYPFLSMSPFGELPVYEDGPIRNFQYGAILRSVGHQYSKKGEEVICWVAREQALVANWMDVEDSHFRPAASNLLAEVVLRPKKGFPCNNEALLKAKEKMSKVLDVYEAQLTKNKNKYLVMDKYTIADIAHLPYLQSLMDNLETRKLIEARLHVKAWCVEVLARCGWTKVLEMKKKA